MESNTGVYVRVSGRVQGVGYRVFVLEQAQDRGLTGWVRNLPNGDVEAEAQGSKDSINDWLSALQEGPLMARVKTVTPEWRALFNIPERFEIR